MALSENTCVKVDFLAMKELGKRLRSMELAPTRAVLATTEVQRRLSTLWIGHFVHTHILHTFGVLAHGLWRNEHELSANRPTSSLNHHLHTDFSVRTVHKDIKLIKTANRRTHGLPDGEQKANGREGLFSTRKSLGLTAFVAVLRDVRFDADVKRLVDMMDQNATTEVAFGQEIAEGDLCSCRNMLAEELPAILAINQR
ncbi:DNA repair protein Rad18, partial [Aureobasidium melanogenum]